MNQVNVYVVMISTYRKVSRGDETMFEELAAREPVFVCFDKGQADRVCDENNKPGSDIIWTRVTVPIQGALGLDDALGAMARGYYQEEK